MIKPKSMGISGNDSRMPASDKIEANYAGILQVTFLSPRRNGTQVRRPDDTRWRLGMAQVE
jgi:hypothetical protein